MEVRLGLISTIYRWSFLHHFRSEYENQKASQCEYLKGDKGILGLN